MSADDRKELEALSREALLDVFEGGLFELITEGKRYPELLELTLAMGIKSYMAAKLKDRSKQDLVNLFMDSEGAVLDLVDYAQDQGLLDEE